MRPQIIDPEYQLDPEEIPAPESSYLRWFYRMSKRINTSLAARTAIFSVVSLFAITREGFPTLLKPPTMTEFK